MQSEEEFGAAQNLLLNLDPGSAQAEQTIRGGGEFIGGSEVEQYATDVWLVGDPFVRDFGGDGVSHLGRNSNRALGCVGEAATGHGEARAAEQLEDV